MVIQRWQGVVVDMPSGETVRWSDVRHCSAKNVFRRLTVAEQNGRIQISTIAINLRQIPAL
jgi:hypothetical protein